MNGPEQDKGATPMESDQEPGTGERAPTRHQQLTFDESLRHSYEREDERYSTSSQAKDWLILIAIGIVQFLWMLMVFLVEPGIR